MYSIARSREKRRAGESFRLVTARRPVIGHVLGLGGVYGKILGSRILTNDHTLVHLVPRPDEQFPLVSIFLNA